MESSSGIPIKIQDKVVGLITIDEKAFKDTCGKESLDVLKNAGDLLAIAIKSASIEREMVAMNNVQTDFISSFPHELRIPITVIKDALAMLLEGTAGQVSDGQRKLLQLAVNNVERLRRLNEELLELSAIAAAKTPMRRRLFDITALISNVAAMHDAAAKAQRVSFTTNVPDRKVEIWGDDQKLATVLGHILDNAIKFNKAGGKVVVRFGESDKDVTVSVSDTGTGIAKEDLEKIFDKFFRVTMRTTGGGKEWGVGLPIVKEIVEMHCGTISVDSEVGKGSVFTVTLPKNLRE